jgi:broad specificity phosphatase PhoE
MLVAAILALAASTAPATAAAAVVPATTTVVLVRHAEKGSDGSDPELSPAGRSRADALAAAVAGLNLDAVIVSDTKRAAETGQPAAKARGLTPVVAPTAGGGAAHIKAIVDAIHLVKPGGAVLVVGHSNTVPLVIKALGGPELPNLCEKEFATLFLLELSPGEAPPRLLRATYGAADPPGATECK